MPSAEMEARLKKIVADRLGVEEAAIVPSARFAEELKADSLDLVELIMALEEEFAITPQPAAATRRGPTKKR